MTLRSEAEKAAWMRSFIAPFLEAFERLLDHPATGVSAMVTHRGWLSVA